MVVLARPTSVLRPLAAQHWLSVVKGTVGPHEMKSGCLCEDGGKHEGRGGGEFVTLPHHLHVHCCSRSALFGVGLL